MDKAKPRKLSILEQVAARVAQTRPELSVALREVSAQMQAIPYAGGSDAASNLPDPSADFNESGQPPKVEIERFVKSKDKKRSHKATVTFLAPANMAESEIMDYITGIRKLGVDVEGFNWAVTDAKASDRGE